MKKWFLLLPILIMLTGCYNYRELNDLAIISGASIAKEGDLFRLTVEVVNPKKSQDTSNSKEPDFVIYTTTGKSVQETFRKVVKESPKKLYGAQMDVLIIDESVAKKDLNRIIDFFARDPEIRSEFYVLIGKESQILEVTTPLENISSKNILDSLTSNNTYLGISNMVTYHDLVSNYLNNKTELALPSIEIIGNEREGESTTNIENTTSEAASVLSNIAIFKDNKMLGFLTEKQSLAYNLVMNNIQTTLIRNDYNNDQFVVNEIINTKTETEAKPKENKITITIKGSASISEVSYDCDLTKTKTIEKIRKDLNKNIESLVKGSILDTIDEYNSDIYGFQELFYKKDPAYYQKIKDNWYEKIFPNLEIEVKSNINIFEKGNLNGGSYHE